MANICSTRCTIEINQHIYIFNCFFSARIAVLECDNDVVEETQSKSIATKTKTKDDSIISNRRAQMTNSTNSPPNRPMMLNRVTRERERENTLFSVSIDHECTDDLGAHVERVDEQRWFTKTSSSLSLQSNLLIVGDGDAPYQPIQLSPR